MKLMHRRSVANPIFALLSLAVASSLPAAPAVAQTKIRLATLLPRGTSQYNALVAMGQQWTSATNGAVTLTIYPGGTMGTEEQSIQRMQVGQLQAATLSLGGLSYIDHAVGALQKIPVLFHSLDEMEFARDKMRADLEKRLEAKGFAVLFWSDAGWVHVFSKQPILHPADLKQAKIFVTAGDQEEVSIMESLGLHPVPLDWASVLVSLQTGLVDTVPSTPFLALAGQFPTVTKHLLLLNYVPLVGATVITKRSWEALPPDQRTKIKQIAESTGKSVQAQSRAESQTAIDALRQQQGVQVHSMTPLMQAEWQQFLEGVYPKMKGTMVPAEMFDEVQSVLADYRKRHQTASGGAAAK